MSNDVKRILIVEDDSRIAQNISKGLTEKGFETEVAYDGLIGSKIAHNSHFDLVILDINLPSLNGYEVCRNIRQRDPNVPILMLTALGETEDKIEGFGVGADDYVVKPFDFRELLARINVFLKRAHADQDQGFVLRVADLEINTNAKTVTRSGQSIDLTPKEFALLEYLVRNKGRTISKAEIAQKVWDSNHDSGTNVVEVYINFLRKKVDRDFESKLIHTKSGMGYVLKEEA
ncbi:MAG: DNA-binding response regulator [Runella slithyformis]|jgi:two-component system, OmpR family, copper resistance phosphate regulon response regulator CusR|nr:MAG: DNA-binding response regulator [Runella slithyformis]TAF94649.1 MAG: DNA-binding response regulator [Runella sp.]TAG24248.1 MAG: DNA-binding response regulator [Cytophagales bacterium]TAG37485.1 MAG: DNA-binding response regulator [Cytophagia bacterium]TAF24395.1 MAG: DNA-binding response regulator [Runella slithyformis]